MLEFAIEFRATVNQLVFFKLQFQHWVQSLLQTTRKTWTQKSTQLWRLKKTKHNFQPKSRLSIDSIAILRENLAGSPVHSCEFATEVLFETTESELFGWAAIYVALVTSKHKMHWFTVLCSWNWYGRNSGQIHWVERKELEQQFNCE